MTYKVIVHEVLGRGLKTKKEAYQLIQMNAILEDEDCWVEVRKESEEED